MERNSIKAQSVAIFSNMSIKGESHFLANNHSKLFRFKTIVPMVRINPYQKQLHTNILQSIVRVINGIMLTIEGLRHDILCIDNAVTAILPCILLRFSNTTIVIHHFNVPRRRKGIFKKIEHFSLKRSNLNIVHSSYGICHDANILNLDRDRFRFMPFSRPPIVAQPIQPQQPFALSLGANSRDYTTLSKAISDLSVPLTVVAREHAVEGLTWPDNVNLLLNIPRSACDELSLQCRFMIIPLAGTEPACGHMAIVTALMANKPVICTYHPAIRDYIKDNYNGIIVPPNDPNALAKAISQLWNDDVLLQRLSKGAESWAAKHASPDSVSNTFEGYLSNLYFGIPKYLRSNE